MLNIYGLPLSSPVNKVRYVANYLQIPYEFHPVNLMAGEHHSPEYLKINSYGKIPAIDDDGFKLAESNAIIRYLASKQKSPLYPEGLQERASVDQWMDFIAHHVASATEKLMFHLYYHKMMNIKSDARALEDNRDFLNRFLPIVEKQLASQTYIAGKALSLADFTLLSGLDACELAKVDLSSYAHITAWRKNLMSQKFYQHCYGSYTEEFNNTMGNMNTEIA